MVVIRKKIKNEGKAKLHKKVNKMTLLWNVGFVKKTQQLTQLEQNLRKADFAKLENEWSKVSQEFAPFESKLRKNEALSPQERERCKFLIAKRRIIEQARKNFFRDSDIL